MKIPNIEPALLIRACQGDLQALDETLRAIEPGVFNLAVRMLGNREDAQDAAQEILLKVTTHLSSFRGQAAFSTWVYQIAKNQLLTTAQKRRASPEVSFDKLEAQLQAGLAYGQSTWHERSLLPEEKVAAHETAILCTQAMLMQLEPDQRMAYVLDITFGLTSIEAAQVLEIDAAAYRKRLSRAHERLDAFSNKACGLVSESASCRCEKQNHAKQVYASTHPPVTSKKLVLHLAEREAASRALDSVISLSNLAGVMRAHPDYQVPSDLRSGIRMALSTQTRALGATI
jgi:RNA polymerase sigma factor (sigma-70 family)